MANYSMKFKQFMSQNLFNGFKDFGTHSTENLYMPVEDEKIFLGVSFGAVNMSKKAFSTLNSEDVLIMYNERKRKLLITPASPDRANGKIGKYEYNGNVMAKINRPNYNIFKDIANEYGSFRAYGMVAKDGKSIIFDFANVEHKAD